MRLVAIEVACRGVLASRWAELQGLPPAEPIGLLRSAPGAATMFYGLNAGAELAPVEQQAAE